MLVDFKILVGKVFTSIEGDVHSDAIIFTCSDGTIYKMYHEQDCCEEVIIEDIDGNLQDLLNQPVLLAEEVSNGGYTGEYGDHETWTFYKLSTNRASVTIRWYGTSNGYYSEEAYLYQLTEGV